MNREIFPFIIGYQDQSAIVDKSLYQRHRRSSIEQLLEERLFKPALARALIDNDTAGMQRVLQAYNELTPNPYPNVDILKKAMGIPVVPEGVKRFLFL